MISACLFLQRCIKGAKEIAHHIVGEKNLFLMNNMAIYQIYFRFPHSACMFSSLKVEGIHTCMVGQDMISVSPRVYDLLYELHPSKPFGFVFDFQFCFRKS